MKYILFALMSATQLTINSRCAVQADILSKSLFNSSLISEAISVTAGCSCSRSDLESILQIVLQGIVLERSFDSLKRLRERGGCFSYYRTKFRFLGPRGRRYSRYTTPNTIRIYIDHIYSHTRILY